MELDTLPQSVSRAIAAPDLLEGNVAPRLNSITPDPSAGPLDIPDGEVAPRIERANIDAPGRKLGRRHLAQSDLEVLRLLDHLWIGHDGRVLLDLIVHGFLKVRAGR